MDDNPEWTEEDFKRAVPFSGLPESLRNTVPAARADRQSSREGAHLHSPVTRSRRQFPRHRRRLANPAGRRVEGLAQDPQASVIRRATHTRNTEASSTPLVRHLMRHWGRPSRTIRPTAACKVLQKTRCEESLPFVTHVALIQYCNERPRVCSNAGLGACGLCTRKPFDMLIAIAAPISNSLPPQESNIALHTCTHGSLCESR